ncbi:MAG: hypothetical protein GX934_16440 [Burkholderiales bacterium]|nr:hypothetical protein [Burkholderiales bacterium]
MNLRLILSRVWASLRSRALQDARDLSRLREARELVVFVVPSLPLVNGGVMSIFSLCRQTREIRPDLHCLIVTWPGFYTHAVNRYYRSISLAGIWPFLLDDDGRLN